MNMKITKEAIRSFFLGVTVVASASLATACAGATASEANPSDTKVIPDAQKPAITDAVPQTPDAQSLLANWQGGKPLAADTAVLLECFSASEIPDSVFARMKGKSFKDNCTVPRSDLRYLTIPHYDGKGNILMGELVCNKAIAQDLIDIFKVAFLNQYPIELMVLIDNYNAEDRPSMAANNTSCFNYRVVAGSKNLSNHARGRAIDINPRYNPYVQRKPGKPVYVSPKNGAPYADRSKDFKYKTGPGDLLYNEFIKHGFIWGGAWKSMQDYQHFEKKQ